MTRSSVEILEYNGKLTLTFGWSTSWDQPQRERTLVISDIPAADYANLIGQQYSSWSGNQGCIHSDGRPWHIDTTNWQRITEVEPIRKPRRGKRQGLRYDWEWIRGRWERRWTE